MSETFLERRDREQREALERGERCPDGGTCHEAGAPCPPTACSRVRHSGPLTIAGYPGNTWPLEVLEVHDPERAQQVKDDAGVKAVTRQALNDLRFETRRYIDSLRPGEPPCCDVMAARHAQMDSQRIALTERLRLVMLALDRLGG